MCTFLLFRPIEEWLTTYGLRFKVIITVRWDQEQRRCQELDVHTSVAPVPQSMRDREKNLLAWLRSKGVDTVDLSKRLDNTKIVTKTCGPDRFLTVSGGMITISYYGSDVRLFIFFLCRPDSLFIAVHLGLSPCNHTHTHTSSFIIGIHLLRCGVPQRH